MENNINERLKIIKFSGPQGRVASMKLSAIASQFKASNRRTLQFCLAYSYAVQTLPKPPRFFDKTEATNQVFLPFSPRGLDSCEFALKSLRFNSFTEMAYSAINKVYSELMYGYIFDENSDFFLTYIGSINLQEIDV